MAKIRTGQIDTSSEAWASWTPTWTTTGTAPSLGNGVITAKYIQIGKTVHFRFKYVQGSTTTTGTGQWRFSPPVAIHAEYPGPGSSVGGAIGTWYGENPGVAGYGGNVSVSVGGTIIFNYTNTTVGGQAQVQNNSPATWANTWYIIASGTYEAA